MGKRPTGTERTYTTSKYKYYGAESSGFVNGTAIWVPGREICSTNPNEFKGKLVLTVRADTTCLMGEIYEKLNSAGASALLELVHWSPPDFLSHRHHTWDPCAFCSSQNMVMIAVSDPDGSLWKLVDEKGTAHVQVQPPYNNQFASKYDSYEWLFLMRILAPLFAFWTVGIASFELRNDFKTGFRWSLLAVVFVIEIPCVFLAGVSLVLGTFGPTVAPLKYQSATTNLFNGGSVFTTMLFALFLREEDQHLKTGAPRRSIWKINKFFIIASAVFLLFWDWLLLIFVVFDVDSTAVEAVLLVTFSLSIPVQFTIAVYFLSRSACFRAQLYIYLQINPKNYPQLLGITL
jgi:hypothetical protein